MDNPLLQNTTPMDNPLLQNTTPMDVPLLQRTSSRISPELVDDVYGALVIVGVKIGKRKYFGGYADVLEGEYRANNSEEKRKVAIKCLRIHVDEDIQSNFKEVMWFCRIELSA